MSDEESEKPRWVRGLENERRAYEIEREVHDEASKECTEKIAEINERLSEYKP